MNNYCIYIIQNIKNKKIYIGQTNNYKYRMLRHQYNAQNNLKDHLYCAINKYGWDKFSQQILEQDLFLEEANYWEEFYIQFFQSKNPEFGYNKRPGGDNFSISEETKKKISNSNKGRKAPNKGVPMSAEQKIKLSEAHKGKKLSKETKQKISDSEKGNKHHFYGKTLSQEHKEKISKSRKGYKVSEESKRKISETMKKKFIKLVG